MIASYINIVYFVCVYVWAIQCCVTTKLSNKIFAITVFIQSTKPVFKFVYKRRFSYWIPALKHGLSWVYGLLLLNYVHKKQHKYNVGYLLTLYIFDTLYIAQQFT